MSRFAKTWMRFLMAALLIFGVAACGGDTSSSRPHPLPDVAPLEAPQLPDWIEQVSPLGEAEPLAQIRIRFKYPLVPVQSLEDSENSENSPLKKISIEPPLPGRFRLLTPRMIGFQADRALPKATRIKITLKSGLEDLEKNRLDWDLAWTFNTEPLRLTNLPSNSPTIDLKPDLSFTSNAELNLDSLRDRIQLIPAGGSEKIPVRVAQQQESEYISFPEEKRFDESRRRWDYTLTPKQELAKATRYRLEFAPGIRPASGNMPSEKIFKTEVATYEPLKLEAIDSGGWSRFVNGNPQLRFNNGLVAESVRENITITPEPKEGAEVLWTTDNYNVVYLNPEALQPATNYTIAIGADLKDQFGQTLEQEISESYQTGDLTGSISGPNAFAIFPAGTNPALKLTTVNLPKPEYKADYRTVTPKDLIASKSIYPGEVAKNVLLATEDWQTFPIESVKNQKTEIEIPIEEKLGAKTGAIAFGMQAFAPIPWSNNKEELQLQNFNGIAQVTNLGVFAQWFPDSGLVRVHHLGDGATVPSANVEIYPVQTNNAGQEPNACFAGKTDRKGTLMLKGRQWKRCSKENTAPQLLVIVRENQDWTFLRTDYSSGAYGYNIYPVWPDGRPQSRGTIFSDRQLYQRGEKAAFTGVAYYLQNGTLQADAAKSRRGGSNYAVTLRDPDGNATDLGSYATNEFATFSLEMPIEKEWPLGYYSISGTSDKGVTISGGFRVAEFKPPNFQVEVSLNKEWAVPDQRVVATSASNYLFGSPLSAGTAKYYVTRLPDYSFTPSGWEEFSFGRQWFWPEQRPEVNSEVLQRELALDSRGKNRLTVTVDKDLPYAMAYRVETEVSDISNQSVADSQSFTALPADKLIGLKTNFTAEAGKNFSVEAIATDPEGKALPGQKITLELQKMEYKTSEQFDAGWMMPQYELEYKTVAEKSVTPGRRAKKVSLQAPDAGSYRIRANFADAQNEAKNETTATDVRIWVTGDDAVEWGFRRDRDYLEVTLDKDSYEIGETATALIKSPYPEAQLYFSVVRDKPLYQTTTKVKGGAPQIEFKVTPDMLPNAAVQAVLVRQGKPLAELESEIEDLKHLTRIGFAPFSTSLKEKYLTVQVSPRLPAVEPGGEQTVELELKDFAGKPVRGQVSVMVVNEDVLQLTNYRPPDLVKTVYAGQAIATRFSDSRLNVLLQQIAERQRQEAKQRQGGTRGGAGFATGDISLQQSYDEAPSPEMASAPEEADSSGGSGAATVRIRKDFRPLAYYNGSVKTDRRGRGSFSFKLPDNLTTWRVIAVAASADMRFGSGENTFIARKALMANPLLPQFARPGDRFSAGISLTNNTDKSENVVINGQLSENLQFAENSANTEKLEVKAQWGTTGYRFPIEAKGIGEGKVRFVAQMNETADAFEVPLSVKRFPVTESVVESGTTEGQVTIPLNVNNNVMPNVGGLQIALASTLIPEITAPARQVLEDDTLPFLEPSASQLAIAASLQLIGKKYNQAFAEFNPSQQAAIALDRLQKLQQPDGGFAFWPGADESDPFMSPYAAESLAKAKAAGFAVDTDTVSRLSSYLQNLLANPSQYEFCTERLCQNRLRLGALMALAELGEKRQDFLRDIYNQRSQLDLVAQVKLARYLFEFPNWQRQARGMFNQLQEIVYETGRAATVNLPSSWSWLNTPTVAQAEALRLFVARDAKPEVSDRLLQGLLNLRRDGVWQNSYANAQALAALVAYSNAQPALPNFTTEVQLVDKTAEKTLDEMKFEGYENPSRFIQVAMEQLPRGQSNLTLAKSGEGTLHYLVEYGYRLLGNQPGRYNGLRVERQIRSVGEEELLAVQGLSAPEEPLAVNASEVFDIGLEIIADRPVDRVVIADPLPAGFEAIDTSFQTATQSLQARSDSWLIGYQKIYKDRVVAYSDRLPAGVYNLHYLVRSVTPGTYQWPGAEVYLQYAPEEFGRSASSTLVVQE